MLGVISAEVSLRFVLWFFLRRMVAANAFAERSSALT
jgi:hypothetical protein